MLTLEQFTRELEAMYAIRTGMSKFADGGGEQHEIERYFNDGLTPYQAVTAEIERYSLDDLGHGINEDYAEAKRQGLLF